MHADETSEEVQGVSMQITTHGALVGRGGGGGT